MDQKRRSGILLHPSSLPGPYGIGDLGAQAYQFVDFMERSGQTIWQILPLGPTGYGDSPYASFSSFAGNPLLISIDKLLELGDLKHEDVQDKPDFPIDHIDFGWVIYWKKPILELAAKRFLEHAHADRQKQFKDFCKEESFWLEDYALFMAIKNDYDAKAQKEGVDGAMWSNYWDLDIRMREEAAMKKWQKEKHDEILIQKVWQFYFYQQWLSLKEYANQRNISIVGDIPIFVAPDSSDVWSNKKFFLLNEKGQQTSQAGVPPDYFSETGQLWGNPLYDWKALEADNFSWWMERIKATLKLVDVIRIDHFRGFEAYWKVKAGAPNAIEGKWEKAPGMKFFKAVKKELGELPIWAEDLGVITEGVTKMRDTFDFPGMRILQFAFDVRESGGIDSDNVFLPHNYNLNSIVYTGSHDNDTTLGWYLSATDQDRDLVRRYLGRNDNDIVWEFIRMAFMSCARYAVIPFQDHLSLGSDARMNTPGTLGGNWTWRFRDEAMNDWVAERLSEMTYLYGRR
jgi:4-alpha-glucanotransferase